MEKSKVVLEEEFCFTRNSNRRSLEANQHLAVVSYVISLIEPLITKYENES